MTVCLTGDVHHTSLETRDQAYMDRTEVEAAVEYAEVAGHYDVPVTLFVTGKAAKEEPEGVRRLAAMDHVEIGGHNYWAFGTPLHALFRGVTASWNGPRRFQGWEIRRTVRAFEVLGVRIRSWRDHAYRHDGNTAELLSRAGITHFSDEVAPEGDVRTEAGLTVVPVNTPPDHEHVYHAFRTPEFVREDDFGGPFGTESRAVSEWVEWVREHLAAHDRAGRVATVLAHPSCMWLADGLEAFERLCADVLADRTTVRVRDCSDDG
jgi:peptidoglycan/xylan/chitin deacetylase (PgdA/CDA1 family)